MQNTPKKPNEKHSVENICITNGAQQGIDIISKVMINENDVIFVENPTYLGALNIFKSYNAKIVGIPIDNNGIITSVLEDYLNKFKPKFLYAIPNGHNPTGVSISIPRRMEIVNICLKHNVLIIEDDPYHHLNFTNQEIPTLYELSSADNVVYLGSFSKILSPGLRVGWAMVPNFLISSFDRTKQNFDLMTNYIIQCSLLSLLSSFSWEDHIKKTKEVYREKKKIMMNSLDLDSDLTYVCPSHGLFIWVKVASNINIVELLESCVSKKVCFVPGAPFYVNKANHSYMRLNFSVPSIEQIKKGVGIISNIIEDHFSCGRKIM